MESSDAYNNKLVAGFGLLKQDLIKYTDQHTKVQTAREAERAQQESLSHSLTDQQANLEVLKNKLENIEHVFSAIASKVPEMKEEYANISVRDELFQVLGLFVSHVVHPPSPVTPVAIHRSSRPLPPLKRKEQREEEEEENIPPPTKKKRVTIREEEEEDVDEPKKKKKKAPTKPTNDDEEEDADVEEDTTHQMAGLRVPSRSMKVMTGWGDPANPGIPADLAYKFGPGGRFTKNFYRLPRLLKDNPCQLMKKKGSYRPIYLEINDGLRELVDRFNEVHNEHYQLPVVEGPIVGVAEVMDEQVAYPGKRPVDPPVCVFCYGGFPSKEENTAGYSNSEFLALACLYEKKGKVRVECSRHFAHVPCAVMLQEIMKTDVAMCPCAVYNQSNADCVTCADKKVNNILGVLDQELQGQGPEPRYLRGPKKEGEGGAD